MQEVDRLVSTEIVDLAIGPLVDGDGQQGFYDIVDVVEIAHLAAIAKDGQLTSLHYEADPQAQKRLAGIADAHARPVRIGQSQGRGPYAIDVVIDDVVPLTGHFVYAVYVGWVQEMALVDRQVVRYAVDLARAGEYHLDVGIVVAARLEDGELAAAIDLEVCEGVAHAIHVADLTGQVKEVVLPLYQVVHAGAIADVGDVDPHQVLDIGDIEQVATILRDERIDDKHLGPQFYQPPGQVGADEAESAGDERLLSLELLEIVGHHASSRPRSWGHRSSHHSAQSCLPVRQIRRKLKNWLRP